MATRHAHMPDAYDMTSMTKTTCTVLLELKWPAPRISDFLTRSSESTLVTGQPYYQS